MSARGFHVVTADNGLEGLRKAQTLRPDVVLLDVLMPKMDGMEMCKRLKEAPETQAIRVILFSASAIKDLDAHAKAAGADGWLQKPYDSAELIAKLKEGANGQEDRGLDRA